MISWSFLLATKSAWIFFTNLTLAFHHVSLTISIFQIIAVKSFLPLPNLFLQLKTIDSVKRLR